MGAAFGAALLLSVWACQVAGGAPYPAMLRGRCFQPTPSCEGATRP